MLPMIASLIQWPGCRTEQAQNKKSLRRPGSQTLDPFVFSRPSLPVTPDLIRGLAFRIFKYASQK